MINPLVHHNIVNRGPLRWVIVQDLSDKVTGAVRDGNVIREVICVHSNSLVRCLDIRCLERRFSNDQRVNYHTYGPDVNLVRVTLLAFEDLRGDIVWSTTNSALPLTIELEFRCETKISDLDLHLVV